MSLLVKSRYKLTRSLALCVVIRPTCLVCVKRMVFDWEFERTVDEEKKRHFFRLVIGIGE